MKKLWSILLAVSMLLTLCLSAVPAFAEEETLEEKIARYRENIGNFEEELRITAYAPFGAGADHTIYDRVMKEQLNVVFDYVDISSPNYADLMNLAFASGEFPEVVLWTNFGAFVNMVRTWGANGYLLAANEYAEAMPNYMALWGEDGWDTIKLFEGDYDGNVYLFPSQNYRLASKCWIWREDMIKELGMEIPTTTDELYNLLKAYKTAYPDSIPMLNRWGLGYLVDGFQSAFHTSNTFWVNLETEELEFGAVNQQYRDMLIYLNTLYAEKLIDLEFLTTSDDQHKEYTATGKNIAEYSYTTRADWANELMDEDAVAGWVWSSDYLTAYPETYPTGLVNRENIYFPICQAWTASLTDEEKILRLAAWLDYVSTDEGAEISTLGIEGETFERDENGIARSSLAQSNLYLTNENVFTGPQYLTRFTYGSLMDNGKTTDIELSALIGDVPHYIKVAYRYDEEQQNRITTLTTQINSVRDEWAAKFIIGSADPADDEQWNRYLDDLNTAGLDEALEINTATAIYQK